MVSDVAGIAYSGDDFGGYFANNFPYHSCPTKKRNIRSFLVNQEGHQLTTISHIWLSDLYILCDIFIISWLFLRRIYNIRKPL